METPIEVSNDARDLCIKMHSSFRDKFELFRSMYVHEMVSLSQGCYLPDKDQNNYKEPDSQAPKRQKQSLFSSTSCRGFEEQPSNQVCIDQALAPCEHE